MAAYDGGVGESAVIRFRPISLRPKLVTGRNSGRGSRSEPPIEPDGGYRILFPASSREPLNHAPNTPQLIPRKSGSPRAPPLVRPNSAEMGFRRKTTPPTDSGHMRSMSNDGDRRRARKRKIHSTNNLLITWSGGKEVFHRLPPQSCCPLKCHPMSFQLVLSGRLKYSDSPAFQRSTFTGTLCTFQSYLSDYIGKIFYDVHSELNRVYFPVG